MRRWASRYFLASLIVLALMATAWGHGGGLASDGCHRDHTRGGRHCHRGGDNVELAVSLNFLAGIHPPLSGDFNLVALGFGRRSPGTYR